MLDGLTISQNGLPRTIRLVTTANLRPSVLLGLVDEDDLEILAEIEGATSNRLLTQMRGSGEVQHFEMVYGVPCAHFINAAFSYAKPRQPNRFNGPDRGAWYGGFEIETSLAQVRYHMTQTLSATGVFEATVDYAELHASFAGDFLDLRAHPDHPSLDPDKRLGYPAGNALADAVRVKGHNGIIYPSIRHAGGTCIAALFPHAVQSVAQGAIHRMTWSGSPEPKVERLG